MEISSVDEAEQVVWVNRHRMHFVPPDILRIQWNGACSRADMEAVFAQGTLWVGDRKHFIVAEFTNMTAVDPATRKYMAEGTQANRIAALAIWGATFHIRVLVGLLVRAVEILQKGKHGTTRFFETENEALAWILKEREQWRNRTSPQ